MKKEIYTAIAILGFANLALAQVPSYVPTDSLKGWWGFNGNANDLSGNNNNGSVTNATLTEDRFENSNNAYSFNGSAYITIPNSANLNPTSAITFSGWVKKTITKTDAQTIISNWNGTGNNRCYSIIIDPNTDLFRPSISTTGTNDYVNYSKRAVTNNLWHHLAFSYDGNIAKVYFDGILDTMYFFSGSIKSNNLYSIRIGVSSENLSEFFNGKIDDIGIWSRALTSQEIGVLYIGCIDTITNQPSNLSGAKGTNKTFSFTHSGTGNNYKWQSNSVALGWQNVPNTNQYSGVTTNSLAVNGLTVSNHNQLFRVITSKSGCADTSNVVKLTVNDVATDSLNVISLKTDTTIKGNTIRQLQTDLANKHDTLYVGSTITTDTLKISIRTGISTASPVINSLKVYPNPAATVLNIELEKPGYYVAKLSSVTGQTLVTPTIGSIDISNLSNGVYLLTIYDSNNKLISTNKVLIVK
jgi:hypothetical protein